jgi:hypothetical protein
VVLIRAKLNAESEHQTAIDSTIGPSKPRGNRGAVMADTVGRPLDKLKCGDAGIESIMQALSPVADRCRRTA